MEYAVYSRRGRHLALHKVAILDIADYRIMRAVMHYYAHRPQIDPDAETEAAEQSDPQAHYNHVFARYLAGTITLEQVAEHLDMSVFDLQARCRRLDVPEPAPPAEATADESVHPHNRRALALLRAWQGEPDELDEEWWASFEEDLSRHRLTLRETE